MVLTDRGNIPRVSTDGFRIVVHLMDVVLHVKGVVHMKKSVEERVVRSLKNNYLSQNPATNVPNFPI